MRFDSPKLQSITSIITFSLLLMQSSWANSQKTSEKLVPFTAEYSIQSKGLTVGRHILSLQSHNETWQLETKTRPYGLGSLFSRDKINETSTIKLHKNSIRPLRYTLYKKDSKEIEETSIEFNWDNEQATIESNKNISSINLNSQSQDSASVLLDLMLKLQSNNTGEFTYEVLNAKKTKNYKFTIEGKETLQSKLGEYETIVIKRIHGKRTTKIWFSPGLHFIPIQIETYKRQKRVSRMKLHSIRW